jgi:hypothetical protein
VVVDCAVAVCIAAGWQVQHWNTVTRSSGDVLDLRGAPRGPSIPGVGRVQVNAVVVVCVRDRAEGVQGAQEGRVSLAGVTGNTMTAAVCWLRLQGESNTTG